MKITYEHTDNATLTAFWGDKPVAWIYETDSGYELHDYISIHTYAKLSDIITELGKRYA